MNELRESNVIIRVTLERYEEDFEHEETVYNEVKDLIQWFN